LRVYQFRHGRRTAEYIPGPHRSRVALPSPAYAENTAPCIRLRASLQCEHMFVAAHSRADKGDSPTWT